MATLRTQRTPHRPDDKAIEASNRRQAAYNQFLRSPEYLSAVHEQDESRDFPFLGIPEDVCGFELRPLTMPGLCALFHLGSPLMHPKFLSGELQPIDTLPNYWSEEFASQHILITLGHIGQFLWVQSVEWVPMCGSRWNRWKSAKAKSSFLKRVVKRAQYKVACDEIKAWWNANFMDRPGGEKKSVSKSTVTSWVASEVLFLSKHLNCSESEILQMPIRKVFQYERAAIAASGRDGAASLGSKSDQLKAQWLRNYDSRN